ncbi:hypothetical protein C0J52_25544, partial [Blattella germanica]
RENWAHKLFSLHIILKTTVVACKRFPSLRKDASCRHEDATARNRCLKKDGSKSQHYTSVTVSLICCRDAGDVINVSDVECGSCLRCTNRMLLFRNCNTSRSNGLPNQVTSAEKKIVVKGERIFRIEEEKIPSKIGSKGYGGKLNNLIRLVDR